MRRDNGQAAEEDFLQLGETALKMGQAGPEAGITELNHLKTHLSFLLISCHTPQCLCFHEKDRGHATQVELNPHF